MCYLIVLNYQKYSQYPLSFKKQKPHVIIMKLFLKIYQSFSQLSLFKALISIINWPTEALFKPL